MNDPHQEFDFFIRRWQVRLFIGGFIVPAALLFLSVILHSETAGSGIACIILVVAFELPVLLLQGWRSVANEKATKERRKLRRAAEAHALAEAGH